MHRCLLALALASCGPPEDTAIRLSHDPCAPVVFTIDPAATPAEAQSIRDAIAIWRRAAGAQATTLPIANAAAVPIRFQSAAGAFHGLYDDRRGIIFVNSEVTGEPARTITIAHEIGHAFGLVHVDPAVRPSLMNPGNTTVQPTAEDVATLARMWGACNAAAMPPPPADGQN